MTTNLNSLLGKKRAGEERIGWEVRIQGQRVKKIEDRRESKINFAKSCCTDVVTAPASFLSPLCCFLYVQNKNLTIKLGLQSTARQKKQKKKKKKLIIKQAQQRKDCRKTCFEGVCKNEDMLTWLELYLNVWLIGIRLGEKKIHIK